MDFETCERQAEAHRMSLLEEADRRRRRQPSEPDRGPRPGPRAHAAAWLRALADRLEPRWEERPRVVLQLAGTARKDPRPRRTRR